MGRRISAATTYPFTVASDLGGIAGDSRRPLTFVARDADAIESEIYSHLIPIRRRIWAQRALLLVVRGAVLVAAAYLLAAFLRFSGLGVPQSILDVVSGFVVIWALGLIVRQRVSFVDAARVFDRRVGLGQTVGTAVEIVQSGADGRLPRLQLRRALESVRRVESSAVVQLALPRRDLRTLAVLAALTLAFTFLATLDLRWPGSTPLESGAAEEVVADLPGDFAPPPNVFESEGGGGVFDPELFDRALDGYLSELEAQSLTAEELALRLSEIQTALAQRAEAANRQREALAELADALSDSSATSDVADSIRRGDYARAASQLSELGKQSAQLSQRARRDLAQRLSDAASRVGPNNADLANRMRRSAQALAQGDQQQAEQALQELGEGVNQAGDQMRSLTDTNEPFDPAMLGEYGAESSGMSDLAAEGMGALEDYEGGLPADDGSEPGGAGMPSDDPTGGSEVAPGGSRADAVGGQSSPGSGAGGGQSGDGQATGGAARQAQARLLELRGRPSANAQGTIEEGSNTPLVGSSDGSIGGTSGGAGRQAIVDPLSVRAEQNFVPWEKRQIVRDYFSGTSSPSTTGPR